MLILGIHSGWQDAGAALFEDYRPLAAVPLGRLTGMARAGGRLPVDAVAECLAIAGRDPAEIGALVVSPGIFPARCFTGLSLRQRLRRGLHALLGRDAMLSLAEQARLLNRDAATLIDKAALPGALGLGRTLPVHVCNRHAALSLLPLFQTRWEGVLLFSAEAGAEAGGGTAAYEARLLKHDRLTVIAAGPRGDAGLGHLVALAVDGLGLPDAAVLFALAPYGEPILAQALLSHVAIGEDGSIRTDFSRDGNAESWLRRLAEGHPPAILAASLFKLVEESVASALERMMRRHDVAHLVLGGELLADPRLQHRLAMRLAPRGLATYPASGESGLPLGGALDFLLARDGLATWLRQRRPFPACPSGRDYAADIDPVLGNAGCRLVSRDVAETAAAQLLAGKCIALYGRQSAGLQAGPERSILFAGEHPGMAGEINRRLDRPTFLPPVLYLRPEEMPRFVDPASSILPGGMALPAPLATPWRARLPAALTPDFLCRMQAVDDATAPLAALLLDAYAAASGIPALLGLPMQIGGEAPLDAPKDVLRLLREGRVDSVVTESAVWQRG